MDETAPAVVPDRRDAPAGGAASVTLEQAIATINARVVAACGGLASVTAWRGGDRAAMIPTPAAARWRAPLTAIVVAAERHFEHLPPAATTVTFEHGQLAALLPRRLTGEAAALQGIAVRRPDSDAAALTILLAPVGRPEGELEALVRLANDAVAMLLTSAELRTSREFWMATGAANGAERATLTRELNAVKAEQNGLATALTRLAKLRPRQRFAALGALFAGLGPFDEWLVVTATSDGWQAEAVSPALGALPQLVAGGPLADCLARSEVIARTTAASPGNTGAPLLTVDRLFAGFARYLCVPCGGSALALATRRAIAPAMVATVERWAARLSTLIDKWLAEREVERLHQLVRSLGVRMYGAVDRERQRIARDLHDHQTQLLTAARLALATDPARTRDILRELDLSLRRQLREMRPATLGRATLREALGFEIDRLAQAGIRGKLLYPERPLNLARPLQELCYQVAREAVSNVIRHAAASRVELCVARARAQAILRVEDNGRGLPADGAPADPSGAGAGVGLAGMAERLALMGGRLQIERLGKITRLTAAIPQA